MLPVGHTNGFSFGYIYLVSYRMPFERGKMLPDGHTNGFSFEYVYLVHRMPFEREINNEFNEIQCVYFLCSFLAFIKLAFLQYRGFLSLYLP